MGNELWYLPTLSELAAFAWRAKKVIGQNRYLLDREFFVKNTKMYGDEKGLGPGTFHKERQRALSRTMPLSATNIAFHHKNMLVYVWSVDANFIHKSTSESPLAHLISMYNHP